MRSLLPSAVHFGANASGKSNILNAIREARSLVLGEKTLQSIYVPCFASCGKPAKLDIIFVQKGIQYQYYVAFTDSSIVSESLHYWPNCREALIFSRQRNSFKLSKNFRTLSSLTNGVSESDLFLTAAESHLQEPHEWIAKQLLFTDMADPNTYFDIAEITQGAHMMRLLSQSDFGITDIQIKHDLVNGKQGYVCKHELVDENGRRTERWIPLEQESEGVKRFFAVIKPISQVLRGGGVAVIDDLDLHLHSLLLREIISLFQGRDTNPHGAQLICSVHDTTLLDLNLLRRYQIYFVNKHHGTQETGLYSLWDFSARKDENVQKGYLQGSYGATPFVNLKSPDQGIFHQGDTI